MYFIITYYFNYHKIYVTISVLILLFISLYNIELQACICYNYYDFTSIFCLFIKKQL